MNRATLFLDSVSVRLGAVVAWLGIPLMILTAALEPLTIWIGWWSDMPFSEASTSRFLQRP